MNPIAPRIAIAHDWLLNRRGAERLLKEFCLRIDELSIFTLFHDVSAVDPAIETHRITASSLNRLPGVRRYYRYLLPWFHRGIQSMDVNHHDLLLSISHAVSKNIGHDPAIPHVCYCLTPMRYLWCPELYSPVLRNSWKGLALSRLRRRLKQQDLDANRNVDYFVAISETVKERIRDFYGRPSEVIYPCIDDRLFTRGTSPRDDFYLIVSELVPQKRVELAIEAFSQSGKKLLVAGSGPEKAGLGYEARRADNIRFLGWVPDKQIRSLYQTARALIFPGPEEFGLVPVEAQACGCPVVAFGEGGVRETVVEGETGVFFAHPEAHSLRRAVERLERMSFDTERIVANGRRFSRARFWSQWRDFLRRRLGMTSFGPGVI